MRVNILPDNRSNSHKIRVKVILGHGQRRPRPVRGILHDAAELFSKRCPCSAQTRGFPLIPSRPSGSTLSEGCNSLSYGDIEQAGQLLRLKYPFQPVDSKRTSFSLKQRVATFVGDGFVDRYSGKRLVFPASLTLISVLLPEEFPYPPGGRMGESHVAFWELWPTIDHIVPVARGGSHEPSTWVCTSMLRKSVKSNWKLEEIGWTLMEGECIEDWDGLMGWFLEHREQRKCASRLCVPSEVKGRCRSILNLGVQHHVR